MVIALASGPKLWNDIPETLKCSEDLTSFKRDIKTYVLSVILMSNCLFIIFNF